MTSQSQKKPNATDIHVGQSLRRISADRGWTQERLAEALGITFQQVQKYMNAKNRITVSRLVTIASVIGAPLTDFLPATPNDNQRGQA